jgi:hypothetical protein
MPRPVRNGRYYEFNRPDAYYEVGHEVQESQAQMAVRFGGDIYTPSASDAKALAKKVSPFPPTWHPAHSAEYFAHYHPEPGDFGHIFYGDRGENFEN